VDAYEMSSNRLSKKKLQWGGGEEYSGSGRKERDVFPRTVNHEVPNPMYNHNV